MTNPLNPFWWLRPASQLALAVGFASLAACVPTDPTSPGAGTPLDADAGADLVIAPGTPITLQATVTGGTAPYLYRWSLEAAPDGANIDFPEDNLSGSLDLPPLETIGDYLFRVLVTDQTNTNNDSFVLVAVGGAIPLTATAPSLGIIGEPVMPTVTIDGDTNGLSNPRFNWSVVSGQADFDDASSRTPTITLRSAETARLRVTLTAEMDETEQTGVADVVIVGIADATPQVQMINTGGVPGTIVVELLTENAPETCANFLRYVDDGFYDGLVWHRVSANFVIQTGAFERSGDRLVTRDGNRPPIASEAPNELNNIRGSLAMALQGSNADSATSQFFVNLVNNSGQLNEGPPPFTVFARVLEGLDVVDEIGTQPIGSDPSGLGEVPLTDIVITRVERLADEVIPDANDPDPSSDPTMEEAEVTITAASPLVRVDQAVELTATVAMPPANAGYFWFVNRGNAEILMQGGNITLLRANDAETIVVEVAVQDQDNFGMPVGSAEVVVVGIEDDTPEVVIENTGGVTGDITLELFALAAPNTVANFLRYVDDDFFDGIVWHRSAPNFVIQTGAFERVDGMLTERPGARDPIASEANNGESNLRSTVAMALRGQDADSATNQFFINLVDNTNLDTGPPPFTVFGQVIDGQQFVDAIGTVDVATEGSFQNVPVDDIIMQRVRRAADDSLGDLLALELTGMDVASRYRHMASVLDNGLVMVTGGLGLDRDVEPRSLFTRDTVSFYDPATGTFSSQYTPPGGSAMTLQLNQVRSSHSQTTLADGRVLIAAGSMGATLRREGTPINGCEIFDPATGTIAATGSMDDLRTNHTAHLLPDGRVVAVGGADSWQIFDPTTETWGLSLSNERQRQLHAAVLIDDFGGVSGNPRIVALGGSGTGADTIEVFDPVNEVTELLNTRLPRQLAGLQAVLLPDDRILVTGGLNLNPDDVATSPDVYIVDPVADTLTQITPLPDRPLGITNHRMYSFGRFIGVFGGEQQFEGARFALDYYAIFDTESLTWVENGQLLFRQTNPVIAPLDGNRLLIAGGADIRGNSEDPILDAEIVTLTPPPVTP